MTTLPEEAVKAALDTWLDHEFDGTLDYPRMKAALTAALPFLPVQGVKVKALEWGKSSVSEQDKAQTVVGSYFISNHTVDAHNLMFDNDQITALLSVYTSLEAAKAAAQADFEARILSALEPSAAPEPIGYLFQHEDTGLEQVVEVQQVEWGFEKNNPRWQKIGPVYSVPVSQPSAARELALEEAAKVADGWADNCKSASENKNTPIQDRIAHSVAEDAIRDVAKNIRALASPNHAAAGKDEGDGWLPIESAPKDGTSILAVCAGVHERTGIPFIPEVVEWTQYGWSNEMWGEQPNHGIYSPTHWRPLPTPPSGEVA